MLLTLNMNLYISQPEEVKKWLKLLLAGTLAASVLAGCGGSGSGTPAKEESAEPAAESAAGAESSEDDLYTCPYITFC